MQFTVLSATAEEIFQLLENLEIDAGVSYLDKEPAGQITGIPLYRERYCLLTAADAPLGNRSKVKWAEVTQIPLCLMTPDTQRLRQVIDGLLRDAGGDPRPSLEFEFDDRALFPRPHRTLGQRDAVPPRPRH